MTVLYLSYLVCLYVVVKGVNWIFAHPRGKQNLVIHELDKSTDKYINEAFSTSY